MHYSHLPAQVMDLWRQKVSLLSEKASKSLADPKDYPNLFPNYSDNLEQEKANYGNGSPESEVRT